MLIPLVNFEPDSMPDIMTLSAGPLPERITFRKEHGKELHKNVLFGPEYNPG
jgi:hypothetical protein